MKLKIKHLSEALYKIQREKGYMYNPSQTELINKALKESK